MKFKIGDLAQATQDIYESVHFRNRVGGRPISKRIAYKNEFIPVTSANLPIVNSYHEFLRKIITL